MRSEALNRAYKLMEARSGTVAWIRTLAVIQALLVLLLITVIGLMLSLAVQKGITRLHPTSLTGARYQELPGWLRARLPNSDELQRLEAPRRGVALTIPETGLYPLVANTLIDTNPLHGLAGSVLGKVINRVRPLRDNQGALISLMILGLLLLLLIGFVIRHRHKLAAGAALRAASGLRNQVHRQMYRLGETSLPGEGIGPVINLFTRDINELRDGLFFELVQGSFVPVLAVGLVLMALLISPPLAIFLLALAGLTWLAWDALEKVRREDVGEATRDAAVGLLQLHEDLSMLRTVRVFGMESIDRQRFDEHLGQYDAAESKRLINLRGGHPAVVLAAGAAGLLAVGMLCHNVMTGRTGISAALLTVGLIGALGWPVLIWLNRARVMATANRAARSVQGFLGRKGIIDTPVGARFLPPIKKEIRLEHVSVEDATGRALLDGLSAVVPAGSRAAIVSLDEDAKHAFACLVPRLLDPTSGSVLIDSVNLRDVTLESLRAQVAVILEADYVFSDTVLNNIGLGVESHTLPRVTDVAKLAHAHHFIQQLPLGYDTVIGPLGHPLPLDQQFQIALARAILHDPSIVIIEEPAIAVDDDTKHLFDDTIDRIAKGRTLLFLPHRLSTIRKCDLVLVIHNGRLETVGHPRDLHTQSKLYRHIQYLEFNPFATSELEPGGVG